ncbi:MAG: signal recognition particle protein [Bacilli bacterium]|nr:signal recognition particle protein [Mollicutes bacterium]MDY3899663.1 signal recognition particle protein [Bacilli bacterium]
MPFESLSDRIQMSLRRLTGRGKINEKDIDEAMREIRVSLLEADVNYKIVKQFIADIKEKALGERVMKSLTPGDQVVKIVYEELVKLMGEEAVPINLKKSGTSVILMAGLQGSGKTTHAGKLALYLRKNNNLKPLLVAADVYRPAAINQLVQLGKQLDIEVFQMGILTKPQVIVKKALEYARLNNFNLVIIDTAGRLQIDEALMQELVDIKEIAHPDEILLTIDAMTGQDAVNVASTFHDKLDVTGCLLTKLDSDTRGGAALSIRYMTNIPIKFVGMGEKLDQLEVFHPDRMAKRILGMGDVLSFIEKATANIDEDDAMKLAERIQKGLFNYNDFLDQIKTIKKMGSLKGLLGLIPGIGSKIRNLNIDDKQFVFIEAIIGSMTKEERKNPDLINKSHSRKSRIANGSGRTYQEINNLTKRFEDMKKQMESMSKMDEDQMEKMSKGQAPMPMPKMKAKKGKGKNKGGFRI